MEELGDAGIVAIAVHNLSGEVSGVIAQLPLDVGKLCIELVVLLPLGFLQSLVQRNGFARIKPIIDDQFPILESLVLAPNCATLLHNSPCLTRVNALAVSLIPPSRD